MGHMKELFIKMQEAYIYGASLEQKVLDELVAKKKQEILAETIKKFNEEIKKEK